MAELLLPATDIPAAWVINNVIGSVVGADAMLLWPKPGTNSSAVQLAEAVAANHALTAQVIAGKTQLLFTLSAAPRKGRSGPAGFAIH